MLMIQRSPAAHGTVWMRTAWNIFRKTPRVWVLLFAMFLLSQIILAAIPLLGNFVSTLMAPLLFAGLMQAATEEFPAPKNLLAGLYRNSNQLIGLGGMLMVAEFLCGIGAASLAGVDWRPFMGLGGPPEEKMLMVWMLYFFLLYSPFWVISWLAPPLIYFQGISAIAALQWSATAILYNIPALAVYGVWVMAHILLAGLTFGITLLISGPVLVISTYVAYQDLFREKP